MAIVMAERPLPPVVGPYAGEDSGLKFMLRMETALDGLRDVEREWRTDQASFDELITQMGTAAVTDQFKEKIEKGTQLEHALEAMLVDDIMVNLNDISKLFNFPVRAAALRVLADDFKKRWSSSITEQFAGAPVVIYRTSVEASDLRTVTKHTTYQFGLGGMINKPLPLEDNEEILIAGTLDNVSLDNNCTIDLGNIDEGVTSSSIINSCQALDLSRSIIRVSGLFAPAPTELEIPSRAAGRINGNQPLVNTVDVHVFDTPKY